MEEPKVYIQNVMLWEFTNNKNTTEIVVFMAKVSLLIAKSKTDFQSFSLAIHH